MKTRSLGIFDSGFGGLTVMRAVKELLPRENIIYFGDTARLPYGNKSSETILRYSLENMEFLLGRGIKLLIVACNTACAAALEELQKVCPVPVIGMIDPAVEQVIESSPLGNVAVLGTKRTIESGIYQKKLASHFSNNRIEALPCPLFVPLVEEGYFNHPLTRAAVQEYLLPLHKKGVDTLLLACTHYPLIQTCIQSELGSNITMIDPAFACARHVKRILLENQLDNGANESVRYEFFVSDDPEKFRALGQIFLNCHIENVSCR